MNPQAIALFTKCRITEQARFAQRCLRAKTEVLARDAMKGYIGISTGTLNQLVVALLAVITERATSLSTELGKIVEASDGPPSQDQATKLIDDYCNDLDSFSAHAESVLDEVRKPHGNSSMLARHSTRSAYSTLRQQHINDIELIFMKKASSKNATATVHNEFHLSGPNSRVTFGTDASVNVVTAEQLFSNLRAVAEREVGEAALQTALIQAINGMQNAQKSQPAMAKAYSEFMALAANHATVFAPFFPALAELITRLV
jgi:hypothetical protein